MTANGGFLIDYEGLTEMLGQGYESVIGDPNPLLVATSTSFDNHIQTYVATVEFWVKGLWLCGLLFTLVLSC